MMAFVAIMSVILDKSCEGKSKLQRTGQRALFGGNGHGKGC